MNFDLNAIIKTAIKNDASDIHIQTEKKVALRINGQLLTIEDVKPPKLEELSNGIKKYMNEARQKYFLENGSADFSFSHDEDNRLRGNVYKQAQGESLSLRLIRNKILSFEELGLPPIFQEISEEYKQGFFLIVGPTGHGKSTSLATMLQYINQNREEHIITIEDPIEYLIKNEKSIIEQREVGTHTSSFQSALRSCMRQDPNIIIIGEMRDRETMQAGLTLAETGHLVFSTMHTNNSVQSIDRIIDAFPEHQQKQIRIQLSNALTGIISQRLVPGTKNGLVFAYEQLMVTDAIRNIIRTEKTEHIYNALQGEENQGSVRLEQCLADLVKEKKISEETAIAFSSNRELLNMFLDY